MNLETLVLYVAFTMGKASSLDLSTDFCKSAFHGGLVSHMQNVLTSTGTSILCICHYNTYIIYKYIYNYTYVRLLFFQQPNLAKVMLSGVMSLKSDS